MIIRCLSSLIYVSLLVSLCKEVIKYEVWIHLGSNSSPRLFESEVEYQVEKKRGIGWEIGREEEVVS